MLAAYGALEEASAEGALDAKTRELISIAVAITTRCDGCIGVHTEAALKAGASEAEIAQTLATAISLNAGAAYVYSLRALEAYDQFKSEAVQALQVEQQPQPGHQGQPAQPQQALAQQRRGPAVEQVGQAQHAAEQQQAEQRLGVLGETRRQRLVAVGGIVVQVPGADQRRRQQRQQRAEPAPADMQEEAREQAHQPGTQR